MLEQALEKLDKGLKAGGFDKYGEIMKHGVHDALCDCCRQDEEFAQAVVQGDNFKDCLKAVAKGCTPQSGISDFEAYRRAVRFYFAGADIAFHMTIDLCASVKGEHVADAGKTFNGLLVDLAEFY